MIFIWRKWQNSSKRSQRETKCREKYSMFVEPGGLWRGNVIPRSLASKPRCPCPCWPSTRDHWQLLEPSHSLCCMGPFIFKPTRVCSMPLMLWIYHSLCSDLQPQFSRAGVIRSGPSGLSPFGSTRSQLTTWIRSAQSLFHSASHNHGVIARQGYLCVMPHSRTRDHRRVKVTGSHLRILPTASLDS